jgi:hypothetical protein
MYEYIPLHGSGRIIVWITTLGIGKSKQGMQNRWKIKDGKVCKH